MYYFKYSLTNILLLVAVSFGSVNITNAQSYPVSDPSNTGNWQLNDEVSDEFDGAELDRDRWWVVGEFENGVPVYEDPDNPNKNVWIGRAPSQFSGNNYRLENGKLILETRWEPDFPFSATPQSDGTVYENLTTPCIIGRKMFQYGYMEIKSKAADAEITSSFWATGNNTEFDMFEMFGDHRQTNKLEKDKELWWSIHDWSPGMGGASVYTEHHNLGFRVADDFHVYGIEWDETGVKYYVDGALFTQATAEEIDAYALAEGYDKGYVITKAIKIWLDQETFPWHGIPDSKADLELNSPAGEKEDGIVDFEIEYVRVWQKAPEVSENLIDEEFYSFDNTIDIDGSAKSWFINTYSKDFFTIQNSKSNSGINSLEFSQSSAITGNVVAFAPYGALELEAGEYTLSLKVWLEEGSAIEKFIIKLENPWDELTFNLAGAETGKWVTLEEDFSRSAISGDNDRLRIFMDASCVNGTESTLFIDDLSIEKKSSTPVLNTLKREIKLYPNPAVDRINISAPNAKLLTIYDNMGKVVRSEKKTSEPYSCLISDLSSGIYLISVSTGTDSVTKKIQIK